NTARCARGTFYAAHPRSAVQAMASASRARWLRCVRCAWSSHPPHTVSTARCKYVYSAFYYIPCKNNTFPRAKLGTAYRNEPRHTGGVASRAQHRCAALGVLDVEGIAEGVAHHVTGHGCREDQAAGQRGYPRLHVDRTAQAVEHETPFWHRRARSHAKEHQAGSEGGAGAHPARGVHENRVKNVREHL